MKNRTYHETSVREPVYPFIDSGERVDLEVSSHAKQVLLDRLTTIIDLSTLEIGLRWQVHWESEDFKKLLDYDYRGNYPSGRRWLVTTLAVELTKEQGYAK